MKSTVLILLLSLVFSNVKAQHKWDPFGDLPDLGWYVKGGVYALNIAQEQAWLGSIKGGVTWHNRNALGVAFKWSLNRIEPAMEVDPNVFLNAALTSAFYEYTFNAKQLVHPALSLDVGVGDVNMEFKNQAISSVLFPYGEAYFFFAQPEAKLEINLHSRWRANLGVSYVWVPSLNYRAVNAKNMSGPSFSFGLKYGRFL